MGMLHDPSTEAVKRTLRTPRSRNVIEAHAGVASVNTDSGVKPRKHDCDCGPNAAANAKFNDKAENPTHETTDAGKLVAAGIITAQ